MPRKRINSVYSLIGTAIRGKRRDLDLSQEELARKSELDRTSIVLIESGRQKLPIDRLYIIAKALQTTPQELLPDIGEIFSDSANPSVFVHGGTVHEKREVYALRALLEENKKKRERLQNEKKHD